MENREAIIEAINLDKFFNVKAGGKKAILKAVEGVSFKLYPGRTLGLVGESGSGKSTIAFNIVRMHRPTGGQILYQGRDVAPIRGRDLKHFRSEVQMVFQDPYSSLDPRQTLKTIVERPIRLHTRLKSSERLEKVIEVLNQVGLDEDQLFRFPHEFSGGQRQRIAVARALAVSPQLIVCDEPVSALDVSVQAQILNLLRKLQNDLGLAFLFVSHDLNVVRHISHDVAVIYMGRLVEQAPSEQLFSNPRHPYTKALLAAMPGLERQSAEVRLVGEISSPINPPAGCRLATRCPVAKPDCKVLSPELLEVAPDHFVSCLLT